MAAGIKRNGPPLARHRLKRAECTFNLSHYRSDAQSLDHLARDQVAIDDLVDVLDVVVVAADDDPHPAGGLARDLVDDGLISADDGVVVAVLQAVRGPSTASAGGGGPTT